MKPAQSRMSYSDTIQQLSSLPFCDLQNVLFEGTSCWVVLDEQVAVG